MIPMTSRPNPAEQDGSTPLDFMAASTLALTPAGLRQTVPSPVHDNAEYASLSLTINEREAQWRDARTTPTKNGLFVAVWQRSEDGSTRPYSIDDPLELLVISTRQGDGFGQFVFSRETLRRQGIFSGPTSAGKRGFRVYPPWVIAGSNQAERTQSWQCEWFLTLDDEASVDLDRVRTLYSQ